MSNVVQRYSQLRRGEGSNTLLAHREFYDTLLNPEILVKVCFGGFGTGKTVAARYIYNKIKEENKHYAIYISLRQLRVDPKMIKVVEDVTDRDLANLLGVILRPYAVSQGVLATYNAIEIPPGKNEQDLMFKLADYLEKVGKRLYVIIDEVDIPMIGTTFEYLIMSENRFAEVIRKMALNIRNIADRKGPLINLTLLIAESLMMKIEVALVSSGFDWNFYRSKRILIPRNMNASEYKDLLKKICDYYAFKCVDIDNIAKQLANPNIPLWVMAASIDNEVRKLLESSKCDNEECVRKMNLELKLDTIISKAKVYNALSLASWDQKLKQFNIIISARDLEEKIFDEIVTRLRQRDVQITSQMVHPYVKLLIVSRPPRKVGLYVRLKGGKLQFGETIVTAIGNVLTSGVPEEEKRRREYAMLYVIKHETTDTYTLYAALSRKFSKIVYKESIIPKDVHYYLIRKYVEGEADEKEDVLNMFVEDVVHQIMNFLTESR